jgi:hypothetical protein
MELTRTLLELEQTAWQSLVDGEGPARYRALATEEVLVVAPGAGGQRGIVSGRAAIDHLAGDRWAWFRLRGAEASQLTDDVAVLSYRVVARRDFDAEHQFLVTSTFVRIDDEWKLRAHHRTPV